MNKELKDDYISTTRKQIELYTNLKNVITEENRALTANRLGARFNELVKNKEEMLDKLKGYEDRKKEILNGLLTEAGFSGGNHKITDLLERSDKKDAGDVEKVLLELIKAIKEIHAPNSKNAVLIKNCVDYGGFVHRVREKINNKEQTLYTQEGVMKIPAERKTSFDSKI
jgi:flagellar biosynthesis/type III secretory pathway chaperone